MRIEKTDMEFVTFDAQDVIMTSTTGGGSFSTWEGFGMYAKNEILIEYNENYGIEVGGTFDFVYSSNGVGTYIGTTYDYDVSVKRQQINGSALTGDSEYWNVNSFTDEYGTYQKASSLSDILAWIQQNEIGQ